MEKTSNDCWYQQVCSMKAERCQHGCARYAEMSYLMNHSNLPDRRKTPQILRAPDCDYNAYCHLANIKGDIENFVTNGENLYICGENTGNGKTSWAIKLMMAYFDRVWAGNGLRQRALYVPVSWFLLKCKEFKRTDTKFEELKEQLMTVDLVVWDDIGSTSLSDYDYTNLLMYIDHRRLNCQANIYTGNIVTKDAFVDQLGLKLADRVWAKTTDVVEFKGASMR